MHSLKLSGLSLSTNLLKYPGLTLGTSHKAAPTVSLSNTHVERDAHSFIPFPSAPIQCPGTSSSHQDVDVEMSFSDTTDDVLSSPPSEDWHLGLRRRHARSCLATSFVHRDGHAMPTSSGYESGDGQSAAQAGVPHRKRKLAHKRVKVPSTTTCLPPRKKSKKTSKRQTADLQFTATFHRSLVTNLHAVKSYALTACESGAPEDELALKTQDRMLVERLWKGLLDHGFYPVPLPSPLSSTSLAEADPFILSPERVDHVFQTEPLYVEVIAGLPTPPPSPTSSSHRPAVPITIPPSTASGRVNCDGLANPPRGASTLPTPPATPPQAGAAVLAMPQLVASLILRHRERNATRPRSGSACSAGVRAERGRSPLSTFVLVPAHSCAGA